MRKINPRVPILLILLLGFGGGGWYLQAQRSAQLGTLSGFFESEPTEVASRIGGRVTRILVNEGDTVDKGQVLIELDAAPAREDALSRNAAAEQARAQLQEIENGPRAEDILKQQGAVDEAEANVLRLRNGPLPEDIDQARARLKRAQSEYQKTLAGARPEEIEQARAAERNARARLDQAVRGLTPEERAQARARLDDAVALEDLARRDSGRIEALYQDGAISHQQLDQAQTSLRQAAAKRQEQEEALRRAEEGTPAEELEQARQGYEQAKAALKLVLAGSRPEDIEAARADVEQAAQALRSLLRGSRREDIRAAEARVAQAQAALAALRAGSRKEQIAQAQAAVKASRALAQSAQVNLVERIVRAPQGGVVERIPVAVGDLINAGATVLRISNPRDLWMRIYVSEARLANVKVGGDVQLSVDGVAGPVAASVESIANQGEFTPANLQTADERGKQVFGVRLRLRHPDSRVKAGMYATVLRIGR